MKKVANVKVTGGTETLTFNTTAVQALEKAKAHHHRQPGHRRTRLGHRLLALRRHAQSGDWTWFGERHGGITFSTSFRPRPVSSETNSTVSEPAVALNTTPTMSLTSQQVRPPNVPVRHGEPRRRQARVSSRNIDAREHRSIAHRHRRTVPEPVRRKRVEHRRGRWNAHHSGDRQQLERLPQTRLLVG